MRGYMPAMSKLRSRKRITIIVASLAVAAGGGAAIATAQDSHSSRLDSYLDSVAGHLGISTDELKDAMKAAAIDQVDAALEEGRLTEEEADALKERIESGDVPPFFGPFLAPRFEHFPDRPFFPGPGFFEAKLSTAAEYLGLTEDELEDRLDDGTTLAEIAEAEGKSVDGLKQALVDAARERIEQAVDDGDLTREEADRLLEGLEERIDHLVEHASFHFHEEHAGVRVPRGGPFW
jgi:hypothetical protein